MSNTVTVRVTVSDIKHGCRKNTCRCPVAVATARAMRVPGVVVRSATVSQGGRRYSLPMKVRRFVSDFDAGIKVAPFEFQLDLD